MVSVKRCYPEKGSVLFFDRLVFDVPAQTGMDLGMIGAKAGETLSISNAFGARVTVYLTMVTCEGATVTMVGA